MIFAEPVLYEGYERFIEVAQMFHRCYGAALRDLIPTAAMLPTVAPDEIDDFYRRRGSDHRQR
jgi:hypothetical protein